MKHEETLKYKVVITTNVLVTFVPELCAYITGQIGQCNVGIDLRFKADEETRKLFGDAMERRMCPDDYFRPADQSPLDGNAFELYFKTKPTTEMISIIKERCNLFADEQKKKFPIMSRIEIMSLLLITERTLVEETEEVFS
jgi:hypothetical protein